MNELHNENVVEALLFTMGKSVDLKQLAIALESSTEEAYAAVQRLISRYEQEDRAMQIIELEDSYQMCTRPEYYDALIKVAKAPKRQVLTDSVLEALSIIAYKQPVTKAEIENINIEDIRKNALDYIINTKKEYFLMKSEHYEKPYFDEEKYLEPIKKLLKEKINKRRRKKDGKK